MCETSGMSPRFPEDQISRTADALAGSEEYIITPSGEKLPATLSRATLRLEFSPSYVVVGLYRFCTDKALYGPAWEKCKHAVQKGAIAACVWSCLSFGLQKTYVDVFLVHSNRVTGLSAETFFGYRIPLNATTYATIIFLSSQVSLIFRFFLRRNIRIARERAWEQTVASRGKGPEFWQPYVEEWDSPPTVDDSSGGILGKMLQHAAGRFIMKRILLLPLAFNPVIHAAMSALMMSIGTARYLHRPYFKAKKMTSHQMAVFIEERKWDYRLFGFTAALFEGVPVIGLLFSISNRVGAAMWAHDLEKRQHSITAERSNNSFSRKIIGN